MITGPAKWYTLSKTILDEVNAGLSVEVSRACVYPGAIAWDDCSCEEGGLLAVSYGQIYLSERFPEPIGEPVGFECDAAWEAAELIIQVVRCAPNPQGQDLAPSCEALDASAQVIAADAYWIMKLVIEKLCTMRNEHAVADYLPGLLTSQGPEGGCVGNEFRVTVSLARG